jgi:hypothetical protein
MAPIARRLPNVRTGKLRALATGGQTRLSMLPDVPTVHDDLTVSPKSRACASRLIGRSKTHAPPAHQTPPNHPPR